MTKLWLSSDLHLGHQNILRMRPRFDTVEEHDQTILENLRMAINKRDSLYLLGDVAFTSEMLIEIDKINCVKKTLILGNHDTDQGIPFDKVVHTFDAIHSLHSRRNVWFSHCPIHPRMMRGKRLNVHGHSHSEVISDSRYVNVCLEQTDYRPILFSDAVSGKLQW